MAFIGERIHVGNITEALSRLKQARIGPSPRLTIRAVPTLAELQLLTRQGINLCLQFTVQDLDLITGGSDEMIIPESADRGTIVLAFHNKLKYNLADPAAVFSVITPDTAMTWGVREFWHILTPDFVFRMENLSYREGIIDVLGEEDPYSLQVRVFRQALRGPFERGFPYRGNEQYEAPAAFYSQIVAAIAGNNCSTSFAVSGLPRIFSQTARARVYFFTWEDFATMVNELYGGDIFRVFNNGDSWLNFFAR